MAQPPKIENSDTQDRAENIMYVLNRGRAKRETGSLLAGDWLHGGTPGMLEETIVEVSLNGDWILPIGTARAIWDIVAERAQHIVLGHDDRHDDEMGLEHLAHQIRVKLTEAAIHRLTVQRDDQTRTRQRLVAVAGVAAALLEAFDRAYPDVAPS